MVPFLRSNKFWGRIPRLGTEAGTRRSLGTTDSKTASMVCSFLDWCVGSHQQWLLDEMNEGRVAVIDAYTAYVELRLPAFIDAIKGSVSDPDLEPFVAKWVLEMARLRSPSARTRRAYLAQVRTLFVAGEPLLRSGLDKKRIRAWLASLDVSQPNRHRAALSVFCEYLILEDVLKHSPVAAIPPIRENAPRSRHLSMDEAARLVGAMESPIHRALQTFILCTAADVRSALAITHGDIHRVERTAHVHGTKRLSRDRVCHVYDRWEPLWDAHVEPFLKENAGLPRARVFVVEYTHAREVFSRAASAVGLSDYTMKDHRHTWAVQAFRDRIAIHAISGQLGHANPVMALKVYGKYDATAADFRRVSPQLQALDSASNG